MDTLLLANISDMETVAFALLFECGELVAALSGAVSNRARVGLKVDLLLSDLDDCA